MPLTIANVFPTALLALAFLAHSELLAVMAFSSPPTRQPMAARDSHSALHIFPVEGAASSLEAAGNNLFIATIDSDIASISDDDFKTVFLGGIVSAVERPHNLATGGGGGVAAEWHYCSASRWRGSPQLTFPRLGYFLSHVLLSLSRNRRL